MSKRAQLKQQNPKARTPVAPLERRIHADIFAPMKTCNDASISFCWY